MFGDRVPWRGLAVGASIVGVAAALRRVAKHTGATDAEVNALLPGDEIIPNPMVTWTRARTVDAGVEQIWPWLVQMGYGRGGWYTNETVDRIVWKTDPSNADVIHPELLGLAVGDIVADGPGHAAYFRVRDLRDHQALVYHSIRHPWQPNPVDPTDAEALDTLERRLRNAGTYLDFSWAFVLHPIDGDRTRLIIRTRANYAPAAFRYLRTVLGLVDAYHAHTIMRGVARRARTWRTIPTPIT